VPILTSSTMELLPGKGIDCTVKLVERWCYDTTSFQQDSTVVSYFTHLCRCRSRVSTKDIVGHLGREETTPIVDDKGLRSPHEKYPERERRYSEPKRLYRCKAFANSFGHEPQDGIILRQPTTVAAGEIDRTTDCGNEKGMCLQPRVHIASRSRPEA
jgi:hypothetical protein